MGKNESTKLKHYKIKIKEPKEAEKMISTFI